MLKNIELERLSSAWVEVSKHLSIIGAVLNTVSYPLDAATINAFTDEDVQKVDQLLYRFTKLQDTLGERVIPYLLAVLQEPFEKMPMIDKLSKLEKLGYMNDAEDFAQLRSLRNLLAHEYPDDLQRQAEIINQVIASSGVIYSMICMMGEKLGAEHKEFGVAAPVFHHLPQQWLDQNFNTSLDIR